MKECKLECSQFTATTPGTFSFLPSETRRDRPGAARQGNGRRSPAEEARLRRIRKESGGRAWGAGGRCAAPSAHRVAAGHTRTDGAGQTDRPADGARPTRGTGRAATRRRRRPPGQAPCARPRGGPRAAGRGRRDENRAEVRRGLSRPRGQDPSAAPPGSLGCGLPLRLRAAPSARDPAAALAAAAGVRGPGRGWRGRPGPRKSGGVRNEPGLQGLLTQPHTQILGFRSQARSA